MYNGIFPPEADPGEFMVRLESDDPYHWPSPPYDETTPMWKGFENVLVREDGERIQPLVVSQLAGTPLVDKGFVISTYHPDRANRSTLFGYSTDGIHFTLDYDHPWHTSHSDTWSGVVWNERAGIFQILTRPVCADRRIATITSPDLQRFSPPQTLLQPDAFDLPGTEFYSMPVDPYEDIYIGQLHVFSTDTFEERRVNMAGRMETHLTYSYDGFHWYRTERQPFIPTRDYGLMGGGQVYGVELLRTRDDRLLFFALSTIGDHIGYRDIQKAGRSASGYFGSLLYEMRLDGFCSMKTWGKDGLLRTKTIIPQSGDLSLNVRTTKHTTIRVQLLDGNTAEPIPGYTLDDALPISGDHLNAKPQWKERRGIAELVGKPIRIEIMMREAELFAIRVPCQLYIGTEPTDTL